MQISAALVRELYVQANFIGTSLTGNAAAIPNSVGVVIESGSNNNTIGGGNPNVLNVISGNTTDGVWLDGKRIDNLVEGNSEALAPMPPARPLRRRERFGPASWIPAPREAPSAAMSSAATALTFRSSATALSPARWSGCQANGDAADAVGNNNGELVNGVTFAPGVSGQAFSLDGIDQYVRIPYGPTLASTVGLSVDAWIDPAAALPTGSPTGGWDIFNQATELTDIGDHDVFLMRLMADGSGPLSNSDRPAGQWRGLDRRPQRARAWWYRSPVHPCRRDIRPGDRRA